MEAQRSTLNNKSQDTKDFFETLCYEICENQCIPFLGAGASQPWLPTGSTIVTKWLSEFDLPLIATCLGYLRS
ncbi:MAG: hypothetical protein WBY71_00295 [Nitrososphaeraceae archaeon]